MEPPTGTTIPGAETQPRKQAWGSLREAFESQSLTTQFRITAIATVTVTLLAVQFLTALWDTRLARKEALDLARERTASMAARLEATGGGALDDLRGHPEFLASTFKLQSGEVLQLYVRGDETRHRAGGPRAAPPWVSKPGGFGHVIKGYLALEPIYVESPVQLNPSLSGSVSIVVDHRWVWHHAARRLSQGPVALLLGCLFALLAANSLKRRVVEPLEQLAQTTRVNQWGESGEPPRRRGRRNELTELASNFDALADRLAEYERAMRTQRHHSSQQVIERTREMEARLRQAEALVRSKDEFLANMSHEIRTPMNGVLGMAELLAGTPLDKRQRRFVDSMRAAAATMMQIINDILDDSKIEAGKMDLVLEPFEVRELAEQAGQLYAGQAERKKLEMFCRIEPTVPGVVVGDALRLRQVLGNLLSNAVKYTERGEIEIRIGVDDMREGHCRLHFSVRDTGPGIPRSDHASIFEAFTQLGKNSRQGGTGLGLSIASRLVRLMGGERIDLASEVGRGTTFSFVLPFEAREAAPVRNRASDEFRGLRALVVEDNATSYMLIEEMLSNWSVEVTVQNRARLVADRMHDVATRGRPFDIVLLDHSLPDATTEELLRAIRLDPLIAGTYVVLLSALDFDPSYEGTTAIAPDVCIAKPVREQLLRGALQAARQPREDAPQPAPAEEARTAAECREQPALALDVLVVDDNAINREVAVAMLEQYRCRVVVAEDGNAAVAAALERRFDCILMDCQMPGMDGYEATEAIRRDESRRGQAPATIVALTANVLSRDRDRCLASGMNTFLAKPFNSAQLFAVLEPVALARSHETTITLETPPVEQARAEAALGHAGIETVVDVAESETVVSDADVDAVFRDAAGDPAPVMPAAQPTPAARLPVLDAEQVAAIRGLGKPRVFERLCEMLFKSADELLARLDSALVQGDLAEVAAAAHALKSPVSNLGGRRLADLLERCETAALEAGDPAAARRAAAGVRAHYAALVAALEAETRHATGTG